LLFNQNVPPTDGNLVHPIPLAQALFADHVCNDVEEAARAPLAPGHPRSWAILVRGTLLEDEACCLGYPADRSTKSREGARS
jgi:hypothetical protein